MAENFGSWGRTVLTTEKILCRHYITTSTNDTETPPYKEQTYRAQIQVVWSVQLNAELNVEQTIHDVGQHMLLSRISG